MNALMMSLLLFMPSSEQTAELASPVVINPVQAHVQMQNQQLKRQLVDELKADIRLSLTRQITRPQIAAKPRAAHYVRQQQPVVAVDAVSPR